MRKAILPLASLVLILSLLIGALACTKQAPPAPTPTPTASKYPSPVPSPMPAAKPGAITLKFLTFDSPSTEPMMWGAEYARRINAAGNGEFLINWAGGPEIIDTDAQPEAVRTGAVDMILTVGSFFAGQVPEARALDYSTLTAMEERTTGFYDFINSVVQQKMNSYFLGRGFHSYFYIWTNKKTSTLADLKGQKIVTSPKFILFLNGIGAAPTEVPDAERYTAINQGLADGVVDTPSSISAGHLYEAVKNCIKVPIYASGSMFLVNLNKWNSLPAKWQDLMKSTAIQIEKDMWSMDQEADRLAEMLAAKKTTIITFSDADAAAMQKIAYDVGWARIKKDAGDASYTKLVGFMGRKP